MQQCHEGWHRDTEPDRDATHATRPAQRSD